MRYIEMHRGPAAYVLGPEILLIKQDVATSNSLGTAKHLQETCGLVATFSHRMHR